MEREETVVGRNTQSIEQMIAGYRAELIVPPDDRAVRLSELYIAPNIDAIINGLNALRVKIDAYFLAIRDRARRNEMRVAETFRWKLEKYPVSCCLEITRHMLALLSQDPVGAKTAGITSLHDFCRSGGEIKRIWGALRGVYFQNAMQAGSYYIDVANDTVDPSKDKVEIRPLEQSGFRNLQSYHEFADVAEGYWKCQMIPNWYFPNLAPVFPIITVNEDGGVLLDSKNVFMLPMNLEARFELAHDFVVNDSRADDVVKSCQSKLFDYMSGKPNLERSHLMHFTKIRDDIKLQAAFQRCTQANPGMLRTIVENALVAGEQF